ncbi:MAG: AbrB/MazE/SpoVT family DNA-binding domain-containing protein [Thermodesulfovibrionales bacterium]
MARVKLSCKGQFVLPKSIRDMHRWGEGTEFFVRDTGNVIILEPVPLFAPTQLESTDATSVYKGRTLTLEDMKIAAHKEAVRHKK